MLNNWLSLREVRQLYVILLKHRSQMILVIYIQFVIWRLEYTSKVPLVKQELITHPEQLSSPPGF
jgi:hypothetical protein